MFYVFFDGKYHPLGEDETTSCCGVVIDHGTPWVAQVPEKAIEHTATPKVSVTVTVSPAKVTKKAVVRKAKAKK